jgi:hypothetical protein
MYIQSLLQLLLTVKIITDHTKQSFSHRGYSLELAERRGNHAFIHFIINVLISISKSILLGKICIEAGKKCRKKIKEIMSDETVFIAIKKYVVSDQESY